MAKRCTIFIRQILIGFSFIILVFLYTHPGHSIIKSEDYSPCKTCHADTHRDAMALPYMHTVVDERCGVCHVPSAHARTRKGGTIANSSDFKKEALLPLKGLAAGDNYSVEIVAKDVFGRKSRPVKTVIERNSVNEFLKEPPYLEINGVIVEEIREGVFIEAVISWTTNVYARGGVEYGQTAKYSDMAGSSDIAYSKEHRITLPLLKRDAVYHFRVFSRDISGNIQTSDDYTLNTAKTFNARKPHSAQRKPPNIEGVKALKGGSGEVYLLISTDKPSRLELNVAEAVKKDASHDEGFLLPRVTNIDVCKECHRQGASHPVGVSALTPATVIPESLPTMGGMITCVTCHFPHGGDKQYFARLDFERDLCIQCHRGESYI